MWQMDSRLRSELTEALLRGAATEAHEREMTAIPPEDELSKQYTFSKTHEARMRALFKRAERGETLIKLYTVSKRAAVIVLIMSTVLFGMLLTDSRVQATIRETIITWYERFILFRFQENDYKTGEAEWFPDFIPDGFEISEIIKFYIGRHIFFERADGYYIIFEYRPAANTAIYVDNEYTEMKIILHDGIEYYVVTPLPNSEHDSQVLWHTNGYSFLIISGLDSEILLNMAVSVFP
jgi:hypothetical protein